MENTNKANIDSAVDAAQKAIDEVVKEDASKTAADETVLNDKTNGSKDPAGKPEFKRHGEDRPNEYRGGGCGGRDGGSRRCRCGKWLAILGITLASGLIGGFIGGKIGSHGGDRFDRMPHGGMMQRDGGGMRGGMQGPMGPGMQGGPMGQPGMNAPAPQGQGAQGNPAGQPNPQPNQQPAPAGQTAQPTPAAPTQNR